MPASVWKGLYLTGYFGTIATLVAWYSWLAPSPHFHLGLVLGVLIIPLLFPLVGLIRSKRYTVGWSLFLSLAYLGHGIVEAYAVSAARLPGLIEIACSLLWFVGATGYIRATRPAATPPAPTSQTES